MSDVQIILQESGIDRLADVVEGIGRKAALGEVVAAVGKHLFRSEGKPTLPQWSRHHQLGSIEITLHLAL